MTSILDEAQYSEIEVDRIDPNEYSLRKIDEAFLAELIQSVRSNSLLQPICVMPSGDRFKVIFGHHRLEAYKRLGIKKIRAIVRRVAIEEAFLMMVVENIQRNHNIDVVAEARGYKRLVERGWTLNEIATKIGKTDKYVSARLRIIEKLNPQVVENMSEGRYRHLTPSHAEHLALLDDQSKQIGLARLVEDSRLSVRQLEEITRKEARVYSDWIPYSYGVVESDGKLFVRHHRMSLVSQETLDLLIKHVSRRAERIGRDAGRKARRRFSTMVNRNILLELGLIERFNEVGWGLIGSDEEKIVWEDPITNDSRFLKGYVEGLLSARIGKVFASGSTYVFYRKESEKS
jgi:ParB family chromosome partitioning protein